MMTRLDSIAEAFRQRPFEAGSFDECGPGIAVLRMSLRAIFDHLSDPMFVVLLSTEFHARDPEQSAGLLHDLRERIGSRRIVLVASDPPGARARDGSADWIHVDPSELHRAALRKSAQSLADTVREILCTRADPLVLNPYQSDRAVVPSMFFGRRYELNDLRDPKQSCVLFGARRIGKTSLAQRVGRELKAHQTYRLTNRAGDLAADWYSIALVEMHKLPSPEKLWEKLIEEMGFKRSDLRPGAKLRLSLRVKHQNDELTEFEIVSKILTRMSKGALFLLDEVDHAIREDRQRGYPVFTLLQSLVDDPACNLRVVFFGYEELLRAFHSADFPLNQTRLQKIDLKPLSDLEVGQLLEKPMERIGVKIENPISSRESIHAATGGMPNLVQDLCRCVLGLDTVRKTRTVTTTDIQNALKSDAFIERIDLQFKQITESLPRLIAFLMSDSDDYFGFNQVIKRVTELKLPVSDHQIEEALDQLVLYRVIERAGKAKEYAFASQVLRARLKSQWSEARKTQLRRNIEGQFGGGNA